MAARSRVGGLVALGLLSQETIAGAKRCGMAKDKLWHCSTHDEAAHILARSVSRGDAVLVKGSRLMMMEKVIAKFIAGLESKR
jgi:UDP-N-acetylmuramyl pentapeptide synthase